MFAAPRNRRATVAMPHDATATVGHIVQSLGVPLTEVGSLVRDRVEVASSDKPGPDSVIEVRAVRRPQAVRERFTLDVHLGTLARRLRLLGIDAAYRNDATDEELIESAGEQGRVLLTRDRGLLRRRALVEGAFVHGSRPGDQLRDVLGRFAPPLRPWSRCVSCNGRLLAVSKSAVSPELEAGTRRCYDEFARCASCDRVFWRGAHSRSLERIVETARILHPHVYTSGRSGSREHVVDRAPNPADPDST